MRCISNQDDLSTGPFGNRLVNEERPSNDIGSFTVNETKYGAVPALSFVGQGPTEQFDQPADGSD